MFKKKSLRITSFLLVFILSFNFILFKPVTSKGADLVVTGSLSSGLVTDALISIVSLVLLANGIEMSKDEIIASLEGFSTSIGSTFDELKDSFSEAVAITQNGVFQITNTLNNIWYQYFNYLSVELSTSSDSFTYKGYTFYYFDEFIYYERDSINAKWRKGILSNVWIYGRETTNGYTVTFLQPNFVSNESYNFIANFYEGNSLNLNNITFPSEPSFSLSVGTQSYGQFFGNNFIGFLKSSIGYTQAFGSELNFSSASVTALNNTADIDALISLLGGSVVSDNPLKDFTDSIEDEKPIVVNPNVLPNIIPVNPSVSIPVDDYITVIGDAIEGTPSEGEYTLPSDIPLNPSVNVTDTLEPSVPIEQPTEEGVYTYGLQDIFPFSIPFDIYSMVTLLEAEPEAPVITMSLLFDNEDIIQEVDLGKYFDDYIELFRAFVYIVFFGGFVIFSAKVIKH